MTAPDASTPEHSPSPGPVAGWRGALVLVVLALAAITALYRDTALGMVTIWYRSETFTHAFLVPPIVVWLIWQRRQDLALIEPRPALWALLPMAGVALLWLLGDLTGVNSVTQFAFVAMLVLTVPVLLGLQVAHALLFPLFFLFFSVPIGEFLTPLFMLWTADFTVAALRLSGIPVLREGLQFVIPSGNWSVVEACSGIRYLIASVTVGTLYAHLTYQSARRRAAFVLVSIIVPVLANWARAYMIVMLGHLSGNTLATGVDHIIYGWLFFGVVIMLMFLVGARWSEPEQPAGTKPAPVHSGPRGAGASLPWMAGLALAVVLALPLASRMVIDRSEQANAPTLSTPASLSGGWVKSLEQGVAWKPAFQNPSVEARASYLQGTGEVGLYLGYYRAQGYDRKLVSSENMLVRSSDENWKQVASGSRQVEWGGQSRAVRTAELRQSAVPGSAGEVRIVVWRIYWVNGTWTESDTMAKVYGALYRLVGRGDDSAVLVVHARKGGDGDAEKLLSSFLQANAATIDALLQQTRARR